MAADYIRIDINDGVVESEELYSVQYKYKVNQKYRPIDLLIGDGRISIFFEGKCSDLKYFLDFQRQNKSEKQWNNIFAETYRKSMLVHVFYRNYAIDVKCITIEQGEVQNNPCQTNHAKALPHGYVSGEQSLTVDASNPEYGPAFPFIKLGIGQGHIALDEQWKNKEFLSANLGIVKSYWEGDYRIGSMFAFLRSNAMNTPMERFLYLWISFNAYYNYMAARYEVACKNRNAPYSFGNDESRILNYFIRTINIDADKLERSRVIEEQNKKDKENIFFSIGYGFGCIDASEYETIYTLLENPETKETDVKNMFIRSCFAKAREFGQRPFEMILVEYAYYLRNKTFHARQSAILYDDVFSVMDGTYNFVNYFLFRYLNEHIPKLFTLPDNPTDEEYLESQKIIDLINEQYKLYCEEKERQKKLEKRRPIS